MSDLDKLSFSPVEDGLHYSENVSSSNNVTSISFSNIIQNSKFIGHDEDKDKFE